MLLVVAPLTSGPEPSNVRPLTIFASYLTTCAAITLFIVRRLYRQASSSPAASHTRCRGSYRHELLLFAVLALLSLATTWTYMFRFFGHSYRTWAAAVDDGGSGAGRLRLGRWLRDTRLFEQAWFATVETPARFWWSQQVFVFAAAWSVFLGREANRRAIPGPWLFMLLGQVVAVSFATNLFFIAVLVSKSFPLPQSPSSKSFSSSFPFPSHLATTTGRSAVTVAAVAISLAAVAMVPTLARSGFFLQLLLLPHVLLFVPVLLPHRAVKGAATSKAVRSRWWCKGWLYQGIVLAGLVLQFRATLCVLRQGGSGDEKREGGNRAGALLATLWTTLWSHPAVSSVGWDVVFCWLSWAAWALVVRNGGRTKGSQVLGDGATKQE